MSLQLILARIAGSHVLPAYTVQEGREKPLTDYVVKASADPIKADLDLCARLGGSHGKSRYHLDLGNLTNFVKFIDDHKYTGSNYRTVKRNPTWRTFYGYRIMSFTVANKMGVDTPKPELGVPCRRCGIHLRENLVSVDHRIPKSWGGNLALVKVFRALGLTLSPPDGLKGLRLLRDYAKLVGGELNSIGTRKYSLSPAGTVYYTVLKAAGLLDRLRFSCVHNYVNLRPVCTFCNSSLRDRYY